VGFEWLDDENGQPFLPTMPVGDSQEPAHKHVDGAGVNVTVDSR